MEDSGNAHKLPQIKMLFRMLAGIKFSRIKSLLYFAKNMSDELNIPLLFDTDMEDYAKMYQHLGCELYNTVKADNGVTRYSLCYKKSLIDTNWHRVLTAGE